MATRRQHRRGFPLVPLLLFLLAAAAYGRLISDGAPSAPLLSVIRLSGSRPPAGREVRVVLLLPPVHHQSTTVLGNLFLVLAYGFLMYKAATYLSAPAAKSKSLLGLRFCDPVSVILIPLFLNPRKESYFANLYFFLRLVLTLL
jgi:hypothetical protein